MQATQQLRLAAAHEFGHAISDLLHGLNVLDVTIEPDGSGKVRPNLFNKRLVRASQRLAIVRGCMAGYIAETLLFPSHSEHDRAETDMETAAHLLSRLARNQAELTALFELTYQETAALLSKPATVRALRLTTNLLIQKRRLSGGEVRAILEGNQ